MAEDMCGIEIPKIPSIYDIHLLMTERTVSYPYIGDSGV
jgi:hypothetical protein